MPFHVSNFTKSRREVLTVPLSLITDVRAAPDISNQKDRCVLFIQVARAGRWTIIFAGLEFSSISARPSAAIACCCDYQVPSRIDWGANMRTINTRRLCGLLALAAVAILLGLAWLNTTASAQTADRRANLATRPAFREPVTLTSKHGVLEVRLTARQGEAT